MSNEEDKDEKKDAPLTPGNPNEEIKQVNRDFESPDVIYYFLKH